MGDIDINYFDLFINSYNDNITTILDTNEERNITVSLDFMNTFFNTCLNNIIREITIEKNIVDEHMAENCKQKYGSLIDKSDVDDILKDIDYTIDSKYNIIYKGKTYKNRTQLASVIRRRNSNKKSVFITRQKKKNQYEELSIKYKEALEELNIMKIQNRFLNEIIIHKNIIS